MTKNYGKEKKSLISVGKTIVESCPVNNKHYGVIMVLMEAHRMLKGRLISKELPKNKGKSSGPVG